jgi:MFS transporter, OFA family, oxalate/formate antiporter
MNKNFYGWNVLAALFTAYFFANGVISNTLPTLYPELMKEFGWNNEMLSRPTLIQYFVVALTSVIAGWLLDKFDARKIIMCGSIFFLAGLVLISRMHTLNEMIFAYTLFAIGLVLCGIISCMHVITKWFIKRRGLAVGLFLVASSLGGFVFNPLANMLKNEYGWRTAVLILGIAVFIFTLLPVMLFVTSNPAKAGLQPDGVAEAKMPDNTESYISYNEALRMPVFYLLLFITGAMWFCILAIVIHQALHYASKPIGLVSDKSTLVAVFYLCSVAGKLVFGYLSDKNYSKRNIMLASMLCLVAGAIVLQFTFTDPHTYAWLFVIIYGFGFAGVFTMIQTLIADYFAGPHYGRILGIVTLVDTIAGAMGAWLIGNIAKKHGFQYKEAFQLLLYVSIAATICILFVRKPIAKQYNS